MASRSWSQKILTEQVNESRSGENKRSSDRSQPIWRMAGDESIFSKRARRLSLLTADITKLQTNLHNFVHEANARGYF